MAKSSNALSAKAKAMYGRRLMLNDYEELLHKRSVSELANYLKNNTAYADVLKDVHENAIHRGQLEVLMNRDGFDKRLKLHRYADKTHEKFYKQVLELDEIIQILSCIRALDSNDFTSFVSNMPLFMSNYMSFDLSELLQVKNFRDLNKVLEGTIYYETIRPFIEDEDNIDFSECETALKRFYYKNLKESIQKDFRGMARKNLETIVDTQIELQNICKIYRMKEYFHVDADKIKHSLIDCRARIPIDTYELLYTAKNGSQVLKILEETSYHIRVDNDEFIYIENSCNRIIYELARKLIRFSDDSTVVYMTYDLLDKAEVENIINIIEGVRYQVPVNKIQNLLIY